MKLVSLYVGVDDEGRCALSFSSDGLRPRGDQNVENIDPHVRIEDLSVAHMSQPISTMDISDSFVPSSTTRESTTLEMLPRRTCDITKLSRRNRVDILTRLAELEKGCAEPAAQPALLDVESSTVNEERQEELTRSAKKRSARESAQKSETKKKPPKKPPANKRGGGVLGGPRMAKVY